MADFFSCIRKTDLFSMISFHPCKSTPKPCVGGFYCPRETINYRITPCPEGTYSASPSLRSKFECGLCDSGFYCTGIATGNVVTVPVQCDAGRFISFVGFEKFFLTKQIFHKKFSKKKYIF